MKYTLLMVQIPGKLVTALTALGLYESEAKVYAALVLLDQAEPRDLVDFLDISKPSVYEGLRNLDARGLVMQISAKPQAFQPMPPDVALKMLMSTFDNARDEAEALLEQLKAARVVERAAGGSLWSIYGEKNLAFKVRDMVEKARKTVHLVLAERYFDYLEYLDGREDLDITLVTFSDNSGLQAHLKRLFKGLRVTVKVLPPAKVEQLLSSCTGAELAGYNPEELDYGNLFLLVVDSEESLYIPPLAVEEISALNTSNRAIIAASGVFFSIPGISDEPAGGRARK